MEKYRLYDAYVGSKEKELLLTCNSLAEVRRACRKRASVCDKEWRPVLYVRSTNSAGRKCYKQITDWTY